MDAHYALDNKLFATEHFVSINFLHSKNLKEDYLEKLKKANSDGTIKVYSAPGNNLIVPSLTDITYSCPVPYIHLRNLVCPIPSCKAKKSKLHTLGKKEAALCVHSLLGKASNKNAAQH